MRAYVIGVFVGSGLIAGFTGCVLASKLQIGQANVGLDYLLPALVGAFLGSTTIKPGRVNVWGTIVGVLILAVGISGIQQLGGAFFVEPLFNGTTLVVAIALAGFAQRRRSATTAQIHAGRADLSRAGTNDTGREENDGRYLERLRLGLLALRSRHSRSARASRARRRCLHGDGEGLHRQGDGAWRAVDRPDDRARRRRARS